YQQPLQTQLQQPYQQPLGYQQQHQQQHSYQQQPIGMHQQSQQFPQHSGSSHSTLYPPIQQPRTEQSISVRQEQHMPMQTTAQMMLNSMNVSSSAAPNSQLQQP